MTLNQLTYFCELAKTEHYGLAARNLYIAQPSLSNAMNHLEQELGVTLFEHHGRGVRLTTAGQLFYYQISPILEQLHIVCSTMKQQAGANSMPTVGCVSPAVTSVYVPLIDSYRSSGNLIPNFHLQIKTSELLIKALRHGEIDMALCTSVSDAEGVTFLPIASFPFAVVMREDDPLAKYSSILPEQLNGRAMVFSDAPAFAALVQKILTHYHCTPIISGVANDDSALFGMVKAGIAVFVTHDYPQAHCPGIAVRKLEQDLLRREICIAYTEKSLKNPHIASLIDYVIQTSFFISG